MGGGHNVKKLLFLLRDVVQQIWHDKLISIVIFFSMLVGFFVPIIGANEINDLLADVRLSTYSNVSQLTVCSVRSLYFPQEELDARIDELREEGKLEQVGYLGTLTQIVTIGEDSYSTRIGGANEQYMAISGHELLDGELFSQEDYTSGAKVCLMVQEEGLIQDAAQVGDIVQIAGDSFQVKGIIRAPKVLSYLILPYQSAEDVLPGKLQYHVLSYVPSGKAQAAYSSIIFPESDLLYSDKGAEEQEMYLASVNAIIFKQMIQSGIIILLALVCIYMILSGKTMQERSLIGVRLAIGASKRTVLAESICKNFLFLLAAVGIDFTIYRKVAGTLRGISQYARTETLLQVLVGGILVILALSLFSFYRSIGRDTISLLIRKEK
jgi:hypothetical protein